MKQRIINFYDKYYKRMLRRHPKWMFTMYYPEFAGRVLEVGCGTLAPPYEDYIGVDLSSQALKKLAKCGIPCVLADGENLPFLDNSFDTVCGHEVLSYTPKPDKMLSEMARVTKSKIQIVGDNYVLSKRSFHDFTFRDWIEFVLYYLWWMLSGKCDRYWSMTPNFKEIRLPPKGREAISAINVLFIKSQLKEQGLKIQKLSSFMYYEAGIVKPRFLKRIVMKIPPFKYLGPMMYLVAYKKKSTKGSNLSRTTFHA